MVPTAFKECNQVLDAPKDMQDCECLQVLQGQMSSGLPVVVSCWKVTADELAEIQRTGRVWLTVAGQTMPPVILDGIRPF